MKSPILAVSLACAAIWGAQPIGAQAPACAPAGGLSFICGVQNAEDLVVVPNTRWMVASGMAPGSGLHIVDTQAKPVRTLYAIGAANARADKARFASCPGPLDAKQAVRPEPAPGLERAPRSRVDRQRPHSPARQSGCAWATSSGSARSLPIESLTEP
jgi:hypothetical protein